MKYCFDLSIRQCWLKRFVLLLFLAKVVIIGLGNVITRAIAQQFSTLSPTGEFSQNAPQAEPVPQPIPITNPAKAQPKVKQPPTITHRVLSPQQIRGVWMTTNDTDILKIASNCKQPCSNWHY